MDMPLDVLFFRNVLPMKMIVPDFGKNTFSSCIFKICKNYFIALLSRFEEYDFSRIAIGDIPSVRAWVIKAKRCSVFKSGQDDNVLYRHSFKNAGEMPLALYRAGIASVNIVYFPTAD